MKTTLEVTIKVDTDAALLRGEVIDVPENAYGQNYVVVDLQKLTPEQREKLVQLKKASTAIYEIIKDPIEPTEEAVIAYIQKKIDLDKLTRVFRKQMQPESKKMGRPWAAHVSWDKSDRKLAYDFKSMGLVENRVALHVVPGQVVAVGQKHYWDKSECVHDIYLILEEGEKKISKSEAAEILNPSTTLTAPKNANDLDELRRRLGVAEELMKPAVEALRDE